MKPAYEIAHKVSIIDKIVTASDPSKKYSFLQFPNILNGANPVFVQFTSLDCKQPFKVV